MLNPITSKTKFVLVYFFIWTAIAAVQFYFLQVQFQIDSAFLISFSLVNSLSFSLVGLGLWYVVKYSIWEDKDLLKILINIIAGSLLIMGFWISIVELSLNLIHKENPAFIEFLIDSRIWRIIFGYFLYLMIVLMYYAMLYYQKLQAKKLDETQLQQNITEAKLNILRNQVNPHFLFNSLNSISSLTVHEGQKAREMIEKLSDFLRFSLNHKADQFISLKAEIDLCEKYLEIEKVRFGDKLNFKFDLDPSLQEFEVPNMILQPLFENAVKYGVQEAIKPVIINLLIQQNGNYVEIKIINDCDCEDQQSLKGTGLGQFNIRERLYLIYKEKALFEIIKKSHSYEVTIKLPLQN